MLKIIKIMKIRISVFALFTACFFLSSCKDKKDSEKKPATVENVTEQINKYFEVSFELVATQDDNMHLYYTEDGSINFNEEQSIWAPFKGSNDSQKVVFKLPEDAVPTDLRVDLGYGKNEKQQEIILKNFKMSYYGKSFQADGSDIFNYFYSNKDNTVLNVETATLKRVKVDQLAAPSLYPHTKLEEEIAKITK